MQIWETWSACQTQQGGGKKTKNHVLSENSFLNMLTIIFNNKNKFNTTSLVSLSVHLTYSHNSNNKDFSYRLNILLKLDTGLHRWPILPLRPTSFNPFPSPPSSFLRSFPSHMWLEVLSLRCLYWIIQLDVNFQVLIFLQKQLLFRKGWVI